jgi:hypothetical protein
MPIKRIVISIGINKIVIGKEKEIIKINAKNKLIIKQSIIFNKAFE